mmetsp:Transcript_21995/g.44112  ORF Transcript_21995/g.44112 Transcript_21995/m.44112 type:complete len:207 (+) Transcript_21995:288-908(+)
MALEKFGAVCLVTGTISAPTADTARSCQTPLRTIALPLQSLLCLPCHPEATPTKYTSLQTLGMTHTSTYKYINQDGREVGGGLWKGGWSTAQGSVASVRAQVVQQEDELHWYIREWLGIVGTCGSISSRIRSKVSRMLPAKSAPFSGYVLAHKAGSYPEDGLPCHVRETPTSVCVDCCLLIHGEPKVVSCLLPSLLLLSRPTPACV